MTAGPRFRDTQEVGLTVNGAPVAVTVPARTLLADFLRDTLDLTGTVVGCEQGACGSCTVLLDGLPVRSCLVLTVQAAGSAVTTVEGITPANGLHPLQRAFADHHGLQCGFCTAGFLMTLVAARPEDHPDDEAIRRLLSGNLCRCTGYQKIVESVRAAWGRGPVD